VVSSGDGPEAIMRPVLHSTPAGQCRSTGNTAWMQFRAKSHSPYAMSLERREPARRDSIEPDASGAPRSAAWLVAEGAFALQQRAPRPSTTVVTVKRSRVVVQTPAHVLAQDVIADASSSQDEGRRVFRIEAAPTGASVGSTAQASTSEPVEQVPSAAMPVPCSRRVASDKRPGPVLHIVAAPGALSSDGGDTKTAGMSNDQVEALVAMLAQVEPILDDIRRAQAFRFVDGSFVAM
jgi:hypothetical protein